MADKLTQTHIEQLGAPRKYTDQDSQEIVQQYFMNGRPPGAHVIVQAGERHGAKVSSVGRGIAVISVGHKEFLVNGQRNLESIVGAKIVKNKQLTRNLLREAGLPTPAGRVVSSAEEAADLQRELNSPIVLKPLRGNLGKGVTVGVVTSGEIREAYEKASAFGPVVAEQDVQGVVEYRCHATPEECVSVFRRILPWVEGDGKATIAELIARKNVHRKTNPSTMHRPIPMDEAVEATLWHEGLHLDYVLEIGRRVIVRSVGGLGSGGEPEQCFGEAPAAVKELARKCVASIPGLNWGGADIMVDKAGLPHVIELNTNADALGAIFTFYGEPAQIAEVNYQARIEHAGSLPSVKPLPLGAPAIQDSTRLSSLSRNLSGVFLSELFYDAMRAEGAHVNLLAQDIQEISFPDGERKWFTGLGSERDLAAVWDAAARHDVVRRLLRRRKTPRPKALISADRARICKFFTDGTSSAIYVTPVGSSWGGQDTFKASDLGELETALRGRRRRWIVQRALDGMRLQVIASPDEGLLVFGAETVGEKEIQDAVGVAVAAVRAVPELRWAAVDVGWEDWEREKDNPVVEGLQFNPWLSTRHALLAGDLARFLDLLLA